MVMNRQKGVYPQVYPYLYPHKVCNRFRNFVHLQHLPCNVILFSVGKRSLTDLPYIL